jgi:hypothetical protein
MAILIFFSHYLVKLLWNDTGLLRLRCCQGEGGFTKERLGENLFCGRDSRMQSMEHQARVKDVGNKLSPVNDILG